LLLILAATFFIFLSISTSKAWADEGMWLANDIPATIYDQLQQDGVTFRKEDLFRPDQTGILNAVVLLGDGTGSFVSPEGLIFTNHHVAYEAIQKVSSAEANYLQKGFGARNHQEEKYAAGYYAYVLLNVEDVTETILASVKNITAPLERFNAIEKKTKELVAAAEKGKDVECEIKPTYGALKYYLFTRFKIKDIRLVYAPPASIGVYGGDIDNFMWPRHTGDFSFLRAYVAPNGKSADYSPHNVPYKPKSFLKVAREFAKDSDLTMIAGYPYRTERYLTSYAIRAMQEFGLPFRVDLFKEWIAIMEEIGAKNEQDKVKVANLRAGLANSLKYYQGVLEGLTLKSPIAKKVALEDEVIKQARTNPPDSQHNPQMILDGLKKLYQQEADFRQKEKIIQYMRLDSLLGKAMTIYKWSIEQQKPDIEREPDYMDRRLPDITTDMENFDQIFSENVEKKTLAMFIKRAMALPETQRIQAIDEKFIKLSPADRDKQIDIYAQELYEKTILKEKTTRLALLKLRPTEIVAKQDPFIRLAVALQSEWDSLRQKRKEFDGELSRLSPLWIESLMKMPGRPAIYPDANGTLRFSYGHVAGYAPRDAVSYKPFTTLTGVVEKHTGKEPFNAPEALLNLARQKRFDPRYFNPHDGDLMVNFITTNDTTGGNSGSPVINKRGELIGILFDGNYESMTSDINYLPEITRSICVDMRYVLFIMDKLNMADNLLNEMRAR
jgi:hypothetical protein